MGVAIYARVSSRQQREEQTIEQQLTRLQAAMQEQGRSLAPEHIFRDDGYSGATLRRPGLEALRQAVSGGDIAHVLITAPDRLARNYVHQVLLLEELRERGCQVTFLERPMSQDPHDHLLLQIRGAVAEYERTLISERLRRGREAKLRAGLLVPWSQPPYGYQSDPERRRDPAGVRSEPQAAAVVREIFAWYLEERATLYSVASRLGQAGIRSPSGQAHWSSAMVRRILKNPVYIGEPPPLPAPHTAADTEPLPLRLPPLVGREEFALAAEKLIRNRREASRHNTRHAYLLRGRVECGQCHLHATGLSKRGYRYYRCNGRASHTRRMTGTICPGRVMPAEQLDTLVWEDLVAVVSDPEQVRQAAERAQHGAWLPQDLQARQQALSQARRGMERQAERLLDAYLQGVLELGEFDRKRREGQDRLRALDTQQRQLQTAAQRHQELADVVRSLDGFCHTIRAGLATADFAERRALVELLIERVVVTDEHVAIHYIMPLAPSETSDGEGQLHKGHLRSRVAPQCDSALDIQHGGW